MNDEAIQASIRKLLKNVSVTTRHHFDGDITLE